MHFQFFDFHDYYFVIYNLQKVVNSTKIQCNFKLLNLQVIANYAYTLSIEKAFMIKQKDKLVS